MKNIDQDLTDTADVYKLAFQEEMSKFLHLFLNDIFGNFTWQDFLFQAALLLRLELKIRIGDWLKAILWPSEIENKKRWLVESSHVTKWNWK